MKSHYILAIPILVNSLGANAEVTLDGSLGRNGALPGPNYLIGADLGQQRGGNLFHSFQDFNLNRFESATFSGPNSINNVISRVTGGNPSNIDGLIRSIVPADMYFLNPNGIMFGPNARLDVQGSFHASTTDYLRLKDGGRFDARNPSDSLLTVAPITAFGFFTDSPSLIHFQGSQLRVPSEITIVGGNILMEQANLFAGGGEMNGGNIKIASVASQGEVVLLESDLLVSSFDDLGDISLFGRGELEVSNDNILNVGGKQAGLILIRSKNMLLANRGFINANTHGGNADETDPGAGEGVNIKLSGQLKLTETSEIVSKAFGSWQAAPVMIEVERLELRDGSQISSNVWSSGQGNHLTIKANEILLSGLSDITITNHAGILTRNASGISSISNTSKLDAVESTINIETKRLVIENQAQINVASIGIGNAGSISLKVEHLEVIQGGAIISAAAGLGNGGSIHIDADKIILSEVGSINSSGFGPGNGKAGNITVEANNLELLNGGNINISTLGLGKSGAIKIKVLDSLHISGQANESQFFIYDFVNEQIGGLLPILGVMPEDLIGPSKISAAVINLGPESAGNIDIEAGRLLLQNGAKITGEHRGMGDAGNIGIRASDIRLTQSTITTETFGGGGGGNITFNAPNLLYLREGNITTSVGTGRGQGGDISIENPTFVAMDKGKIIAQADAGHGGNIRIVAEQFIKSPESLISASSRLGLDGEVKIDSPIINLDDFLVVLPGTRPEAQFSKRCQNIEELDDISTFIKRIHGDGRPRMPDNHME